MRPFLATIFLISSAHNAFGGIPDHYCGLYAAHAAMKAVGISVTFDSLCDGKYLRSFQGSSLGELERAVKDSGGYAQPMAGLTATALRNSDNPIVLHVRRLGLNSDFNHWVTYLGIDQDGRARILDAPTGVASMEFAELNALWDGIGLVVAAAPIDHRFLWCASMVEGMTILSAAIATLVAFRFLVRPRHPWFALPVTAIVLAAVNALSQDSFLYHPNAVGLVFGHHHDPHLLEISRDRMAEIVRTQSHLVIDCRYPWDFSAAHIPTAKSLPVSYSPAEQMAFLRDYPRQTPIIVYCQSPSCQWSHSLAAAIYHFGFRDTAVYPGGWNEWNQYGNP